MEKIGIDVHKVSSQLCIQTVDGEILEVRIPTTRESFKKFLGERAPARILMEASTESEWVARCIEELGHEVIVADPNFAPMYSTRSRKVKTDKRDARALCDACALGAYRASHRTSDASRDSRAHIAVREVLVQTRTKYISLARSLLRQQGHRVPSGGAPTFSKRVLSLELPKSLCTELAPLLAMMEQLNKQIARIDKQLERLVASSPIAERLCTTPSVGTVTAVTFVAMVDEISRFETAKQLRAYFGLVPREMSSGEKQHRGRITKAGNSRMRYLLVEAAWGILRYEREETRALREWALRIAVRRGKQIAAVALARKLAGILFAMWRDGTKFGQRNLTTQSLAA